MQMRALTLSLLIVIGAIGRAQAEQFVGGYYACVSRDLLHEINTATERQKDWLLKNGCVVTRGGIEVHDLGFDGFAVKKVRAQLQGVGPVILWTPMENVRR